MLAVTKSSRSKNDFPPSCNHCHAPSDNEAAAPSTMQAPVTIHAAARGENVVAVYINKGPAVGSMPTLKTAGKITSPANTATSVSMKATCRAVCVMLVSFLK